MVRNWHFGHTIRTREDIHREFFTRFSYENNGLDHFNDEWQRYRDNDNHMITQAGLRLVARLRGGLVPGGVESGMIRSRYTQQFGYFEARLKVPRVRGAWMSFWLIPATGRVPPEIDIAEIVDNGREKTDRSYHILHGMVGTTRSSLLDHNGGYTAGWDFADDFHSFAIEWTPRGVRHFVDDLLVGDRDFAWMHSDKSPPGRAELILNLAIGGAWPGAPTDASAFPAFLDVDYLRIYA
jgi:beta-glucanase (GH16 family)